MSNASDPRVYALERTISLLEAALAVDRTRRWWELPDRRWVGRAEHVVFIARAALGADR